ncbi:unnamed protein product [Acanthoscelides obtectus]|uniref:Fibronectin type-III domain-containing protein n=1 Tax=Acanthoscelides obtectus TaxID=200917 RepID=A0A9P0K2Q4_ACAOB|nr:unnamed protein product [Acanthoscelides obtectus]CAK1627467.1 Cytokine receptor [Acanthoscelides obtectus]
MGSPHQPCLLIFIAVLSSIAGAECCTCAKMKTLGYTVPSGDITLLYGDALNITCNLCDNSTLAYGENASALLYFERNNDLVPKEEIEIINSTSIRLHVQRHPMVKKDMYYCLFNDTRNRKEEKLVCMNTVIVGVPPQNVTDFSCISRNYEDLVCTWTPPENYVNTSYNLSYTLKGRAGRLNPHRCPNLEYEKGDPPKMHCFWNISTNPQYRQAHPAFDFTLTMWNVFNMTTQVFPFDHFKNVRPNAPEKLTANATSPHSILLSWKIPSSLNIFPPGVHHRILYQCQHYEKKWQFGGLITNISNKSPVYELKNLKYAHALCDIRVSIRSAEATEERMWSDNATVTARTESDIPDGPPDSTYGSFEIVSHDLTRHVYIYWKQIKEEQKNGQNFTYVVEVEGFPNMHPVELTRAYAKFENLEHRDYFIHIRSKNEKGQSLSRSTVHIPKEHISEPLYFSKVAYKDTLFELSWEPPKTYRKISNYTIFWCNNDNERPYQCQGDLDWTIVPSNVVKHNQTLPRRNIYQFAISANTEEGSSGMIWAECTGIANKQITKMKTVWINSVGSDFIEVRWRMDCSERTEKITGFVVYYCPIGSPSSQINCKEPQKNVTIHGNKTIQKAVVHNLMPYTSYRLTVSSIINNNNFSPTSDPMLNTTTEAAPSTPPLNVTVYKVTNSSISLKWEKPATINGVLKYYMVYYNNNSTKVDPHHNNVTLTDLMSFKNYTISVEACTVACSKPSEKMTVTTNMWQPGKMKKPFVSLYNDSLMVVAWDRPNPPRGKINYYELRIVEKFVTQNLSLVTPKRVDHENYSIADCGESGKYDDILVSVRAVNVLDQNTTYYGPWSDTLEAKCSQFNSLIYVVLSILLVCIAAGFLFVFKKLYIVCKNMQNVEVKLPPGLAPVVEQRDPEKNSPEDMDHHSGSDDALLLTKVSADSSGCSSAPDSITSSLETGTHVSNSDSGTEQPMMIGDDCGKGSLRQRNVSSKGYVLPDAMMSVNWGSKTPPPGSNYCVLGVDPAIQSDTELPYISNSTGSLPYISCDSPPPTTPYVMTGDFVKTTNPGYVPYSPPEPSSKKSMGYVMAGLTKDMITPNILQCKPSPEEKPGYVKAENLANLKTGQFAWQSQPEPALPKTGYVSVGDALPPAKTTMEITKGYVPHRQFETKALKED